MTTIKHYIMGTLITAAVGLPISAQAQFRAGGLGSNVFDRARSATTQPQPTSGDSLIRDVHGDDNFRKLKARLDAIAREKKEADDKIAKMKDALEAMKRRNRPQEELDAVQERIDQAEQYLAEAVNKERTKPELIALADKVVTDSRDLVRRARERVDSTDLTDCDPGEENAISDAASATEAPLAASIKALEDWTNQFEGTISKLPATDEMRPLVDQRQKIRDDLAMDLGMFDIPCNQEFKPGQEVTIKSKSPMYSRRGDYIWMDIVQPEAADGAVGYNFKGADTDWDGEFGKSYVRAKFNGTSMTIQAPSQPGTYELRLGSHFTFDGYAADKSLGTQLQSCTITVKGSPVAETTEPESTDGGDTPAETSDDASAPTEVASTEQPETSPESTTDEDDGAIASAPETVKPGGVVDVSLKDEPTELTGELNDWVWVAIEPKGPVRGGHQILSWRYFGKADEADTKEFKRAWALKGYRNAEMHDANTHLVAPTRPGEYVINVYTSGFDYELVDSRPLVVSR